MGAPGWSGKKLLARDLAIGSGLDDFGVAGLSGPFGTRKAASVEPLACRLVRNAAAVGNDGDAARRFFNANDFDGFLKRCAHDFRFSTKS